MSDHDAIVIGGADPTVLPVPYRGCALPVSEASL